MRTNKGQLVSQHLEGISRAALEKHQDIIKQYVRNRQGVYALYREEKLKYVGLASNLRSRLGRHLKDRHRNSWNRFSVYLTIGHTHLKEMESLLIRVAKPSENAQKGKFKKSEDLQKRFVRDVRLWHKNQLMFLLGKKQATKVEETTTKGKQPVLANYFNGSKKLRAYYKGKIIKALIRPNGLIRFDGQDYRTPSLAAAKACKRATCNGWRFWHYERAPGDWVKLTELRR